MDAIAAAREGNIQIIDSTSGYRIARVWNADVNRDPDAAADTIWAFLQGENPSHSATA